MFYTINIECNVTVFTNCFNIYGVEQRPADRKVSYVSETVSVNDPDTEFTLSSSHALGSFIQTRSEHIGYVAKLWKVVTVNGVETERKQVNRSSYQASCRKVTIGTKGATAEQIAAIQAALATKDDNYIKSVVTALANPTQTPDAGATTPTPDAGTTTPTPDAGTTPAPDAGTTTPDTGATAPETGDGAGEGNGSEEGENTNQGDESNE